MIVKIQYFLIKKKTKAQTIYYINDEIMIRHFFLDKSATLVKGSSVNTGMNPILAITYGSTISRGVIHFDVNEISEWISENGYNNIDKLHVRLKMFNCMYSTEFPFYDNITAIPGGSSKRATSFDLSFFELKQPFDSGIGFDFDKDNSLNAKYSEDGANWKQAKNLTNWTIPGAFVEGTEFYKQHFDLGNENIDVDITNYILDSIESGVNNGIGIKFDKPFEESADPEANVVTFFTDRTNTFFHPFIEVEYDEVILDNRGNFTNNTVNYLYLYANENGAPQNLDELPICKVDDEEFEVEQVSKGVYKVTVDARELEFTENKMFYDVWSNIKVNGIELPEVELEFSVIPLVSKYLISDLSYFRTMLSPIIYGLNDNENVDRGQIIELTVDFRKKYTTDKKELVDNSSWRLYTKDGDREIDVFPWNKVNMSFLNNYILLYTSDLVPGKYYIDISVVKGKENRIFKDVLHFNINNNITERFH